MPFCPQICPYCDFHKMRRHAGLVDAYLDRLAEEIEGLRPEASLETVYFGGGTPSHLTDPELDRIVAAIDSRFGWPPRADSTSEAAQDRVTGGEVTLEADPLTFDRQRLEHWRQMGVTRLSLGVQSLSDATLAFLGRGHTADDAVEAVNLALDAGFDVSADVITSVPGQDAAADLSGVAALGVPHISVYSLTVEPHTPFAFRGVTVDPDVDADNFDLAAEILAEHGLRRYEVSNFARPGSESQHNQVYWHGDLFHAAGPGATGLYRAGPGALLAERRRNPLMRAWLEGQPPEAEPVDANRYVEDALMTGLRTRAGVDLDVVAARTGVDVLDRYAAEVEALVDAGLLAVTSRRLVATPDGLRLLNRVVAAFL